MVEIRSWTGWQVGHTLDRVTCHSSQVLGHRDMPPGGQKPLLFAGCLLNSSFCLCRTVRTGKLHLLCKAYPVRNIVSCPGSFKVQEMFWGEMPMLLYICQAFIFCLSGPGGWSKFCWFVNSAGAAAPNSYHFALHLKLASTQASCEFTTLVRI